jgi:hypothetical protein
MHLMAKCKLVPFNLGLGVYCGYFQCLQF